MKIDNNVVPAHTFDDLLLLPRHSNIKSRKEVDLTMKLGRMTLSTPIISANMSTVTGPDMAIVMHHLGGLGILHRYAKHETIIDWISKLKEHGVKYIVPSIGANNGEVEKAFAYIKAGATGICVDVAHGHSEAALNTVERLANLGLNIDIIGGNVCTYEGAKDMFMSGANIVKVGVGPGAACTTRIVTGHGAPQAWAIEECVDAAEKYGHLYNEFGGCIIADGGIRNSGDAVKAFGLGADAVMIGSLLAGCDESPSEYDPETKTKRYMGMASAEARSEFDNSLDIDDYTPEGVATVIPYTGPTSKVINKLRGGIASGCSYSGVRSLVGLFSVANFIKVTPASTAEGQPHILTRK